MWILSCGRFSFPVNYGIVFSCAFIAFVLGIPAFLLLRESPYPSTRVRIPFKHYLKKIPYVLKQYAWFKWYVLGNILLASSFMSVAFFTPNAIDRFFGGAASEAGSEIGLFTLLYFIGFSLGGLTLGFYGNRNGFRHVLSISGLSLCIAGFLAVVSPSLIFYRCVFLFHGIQQAGYWLGTTNFIIDFSGVDDRVTCSAAMNTLTAPFVLFLPLLGGWIANNFSIAIPFMLTLGLALSAGLVFLGKLPSGRNPGVS